MKKAFPLFAIVKLIVTSRKTGDATIKAVVARMKSRGRLNVLLYIIAFSRSGAAKKTRSDRSDFLKWLSAYLVYYYSETAYYLLI